MTSPTRKLPPHWAGPSAPRALRRHGRQSGSGQSPPRRGLAGDGGPRRPMERTGCPLGRPVPPLPQPRGGPNTPAQRLSRPLLPVRGQRPRPHHGAVAELVCATPTTPGSGDHTAAHGITRLRLGTESAVWRRKAPTSRLPLVLLIGHLAPKL